MKLLKIIIAISVLMLTASPIFAQNVQDSLPNVMVNKNPDGTIKSISVTGTVIYLDAEGNVTTREKHEEFIRTHGGYSNYLSVNKDMAIMKMEKIYLDEEEVVGKILTPLAGYRDLDGQEIKIIDGESPFLLCFWDTSCGNCIVELQVLNTLAREFPGLRIIAITDDDLAKIKKFMEDKHIVWNDITVVTDYKDEYFSTIQSKVHPTTVLVSKSGVIEKIYYGNTMRQMIVDLDAILPKQNSDQCGTCCDL